MIVPDYIYDAVIAKKDFTAEKRRKAKARKADKERHQAMEAFERIFPSMRKTRGILYTSVPLKKEVAV